MRLLGPSRMEPTSSVQPNLCCVGYEEPPCIPKIDIPCSPRYLRHVVEPVSILLQLVVDGGRLPSAAVRYH